MPTSYVARPNLLKLPQAQEILRPHLPGLYADFQEAWDWVEAIFDQDPERRATFDASIHAAMVFHRFVVLSYRRFTGHETVKVKRAGRMMTINLGGGLLLRFKKFNKDLHSCNVKTNTQARIYWNLTFEGMEPATCVTFGYKLDPANRKVVGVYVTCPVGWDRNEWVLPINEASSETIPMFGGDPQPTAPQAPGFTIIPLAEKKADGQ